MALVIVSEPHNVHRLRDQRRPLQLTTELATNGHCLQTVAPKETEGIFYVQVELIGGMVFERIDLLFSNLTFRHVVGHNGFKAS